MEIFFKRYMLDAGIEYFKELARLVGMKEHNLLNKVKHPDQFRIYEIRAIDEYLHFTPEDLVKLIRGGKG